MISVIIPTLDEARRLPALLRAWQALRTLVDQDLPIKRGLSNLYHWCSQQGTIFDPMVHADS